MKLLERLIIRPPRIYRAIYPRALWKVPLKEGENTVFLTFDDGPEPSTTPFILDQLDRYGQKATFFVVGENALRNPGLIEEIKRRGHTLGNHTMHHTRGLRTRKRRYITDIDNETPLLGTRLFRPPHGFMRPSQYQYLKKRYHIVMFDVVTRDYDSSLAPEQVLANVKRFTRKGSIIVFHDSLKAKRHLFEVLPLTLQWLKSQGYESRGISME